MHTGQFINDGENYEANTSITPSTWINYLFNDECHKEISQTMQVKTYGVGKKNRK